VSSPVLITASAGPGSFGNPGPIELGGNLYVALNAITTFVVYQSTDDGLTWAELDAINAPTGIISESWSACTDGTNIWIAFFNSSNVLSYVGFDTSTGLWGIVSTVINIGLSVSQVAYRSSDNSLIVCGDVAGLQQYCIITIGGSATAFATCSNNAVGFSNFCIAILQGAGSVLWFVFTQASNTSGGQQFLQIQSLTIPSTLGSVVDVDSSGISAGIGVPLVGGYSDGVTFALAWQPDGAIQTAVIWEAPTSTMVFVSQNLAAPSSIGLRQISVAVSAGTGVIVVLGLSNETMIFFVDTGGGFGSSTILVSASFVGVRNFTNILDPTSATGWAMIFTEASGVYYLAGAAPIIPVIAAVVYLSAVGVQVIPSVGSLCRYAQLRRCQKAPARTVLSSNLLVFGSGS
jgi:hypothetical protein